jgi:hypothetical protein
VPSNSNIVQALDTICRHRDVVPAYYHRASGAWIVTGVAKTNGGAIIVGPDGRFGGSFTSKRAALEAISNS